MMHMPFNSPLPVLFRMMAVEAVPYIAPAELHSRGSHMRPRSQKKKRILARRRGQF